MVLNMEEFYIADKVSLQTFCEKISDSEWLAIDTEFIREKTFFPNLCLIQVCNDKYAAAIDPIKIKDISCLLDIIFSQKILKIFHAGNQDLEIFFNNCKKVPTPIFDTQPAAALLGHGDQVGYANLVKSFFDIELKKDQSRTNWMARPLTKDQIRYALDDVIYLGKIYTIMKAQLSELDRLNWLNSDFDKLTDIKTYRPNPYDFWKRIKGKRNLNSRQLATLRELAGWREEMARNRNMPRNWLAKDGILVEISRQMPMTMEDFDKLNEVAFLFSNEDKKELIKLISIASNLSDDQLPESKSPQKRLTPQQQAMTSFLNTCLCLIASQHKLSPQVIATNKDIQKFVLGDEASKLNNGWRKDIAGELLNELKNGSLQLTNEHGKLKIL